MTSAYVGRSEAALGVRGIVSGFQDESSGFFEVRLFLNQREHFDKLNSCGGKETQNETDWFHPELLCG